VIALPLTAVIGGMITIYLAVSTSDGLVVDDYYERGKAINLDLARDRAAARYRLLARFSIDARNNRVNLTLEASGYRLPEVLRLSLLHPTRAGHDQVVELRRVGAADYRGGIRELARGHWYVQLAADDWRLSGSMTVPLTEPMVMKPLPVEGP
jgi:hypothetical protein